MGTTESRETQLASFWEEHRRRRQRARLAGFCVCIPLWLLSVVPLARESMDGREGAKAVAVYVAVGALTLGVAVAIRGVYGLLRKRQFWSPWVFLIAAVVAIGGYAVQSAGEEVPVAGGAAQESGDE
jgi:hypothetical protein